MAAMTILGVIGVLGMLITPIRAGIETKQTKDTINQQAKNAKDRTNTIVNELEKIRTGQQDLSDELKSKFDEYWNQLGMINAKIRVSMQEHSKSYRSIQMWGLIIVIWLGFLLLTKKFIQIWKEWK